MIRREIGATVVFVAAAAAAVVGWDTASVPPATAPVAGDVLPGATLFRVKGCASCHIGPSGTTNPGTGPTIGPDLSDAASWAGERRPGMSAEEYLAESVRARRRSSHRPPRPVAHPAACPVSRSPMPSSTPSSSCSWGAEPPGVRSSHPR